MQLFRQILQAHNATSVLDSSAVTNGRHMGSKINKQMSSKTIKSVQVNICFRNKYEAP